MTTEVDARTAEHLADASRALRTARRATGSRRTDALKAVARHLVLAREGFTRDGSTDWEGRSGDYRKAVQVAYVDAGYDDPDERRTVAASVRAHVIGVMTELHPELPRVDSETRNATRRARSKLASAATGTGAELTPEEALDAALRLVQGVQVPEVGKRQHKALQGRLDALRDAVAELSDKIK